jgi:DNA-binding transcriptional regulator LsrR (DeoR family)
MGAVEAARKEGTVVFATAANAELRKQLEPALKKKFGITLEYVPGRAAEQTAKSVIEQIGSLRVHTARMMSSRFMTSISSSTTIT